MTTHNNEAMGLDEGTLLAQKTELATRAVDMLMFGGAVGQSLRPMAAMIGLPEMSISLIFPTKKPANMRPFLDCLSSIIDTARDDRVGLPDFTQQLATAITTIRAIAQEEK